MYHGNFRGTVDTSGPKSAWGICDRCGVLVDHSCLKWQWDWQGVQLVNLQILVCPECLDIPFLPRKVILIPPDPIPIQNPRPPAWAEQEGYTDPVIPNPWPDG